MLRQIATLCLVSTLGLGLGLSVGGCNWNGSGHEPLSAQEEARQQEEKTRENVAKATAEMKPALESAGRELGQATERAAEDARAAAEGVKEGWSAGTHGQGRVDLNSASKRDLVTLPGITADDADRIIQGRPYRDKRDLVTNHILSESHYAEVRDQIVVR